MKITFERNENRCFTDNNVAKFSMSESFMRMADKLAYSMERSLTDVIEDEYTLYISVPEDMDGDTKLRTVAAWLVNKEEENDCPFQDGRMIDEYGRVWIIEDDDIAFTTREESERFTKQMNTVDNIIDLLQTRKSILEALEENTQNISEMVATLVATV